MYEIVQKLEFSWETYEKAFQATCQKRGTVFSNKKIETELDNISTSEEMEKMWNQFRKRNHFVPDIEYLQLMRTVSDTIKKMCEISEHIS